MSSNYRAICLSHDPGLVIDHDYTHGEAKSLTIRDRLEGHEHCDIVLGRYSYPLIEVACLGRQLPEPTGCKSYHSSPEWIDRDWLRLLAAATAPPNAVDPEVLRPLIRGCWPLERLRRLRGELGMPEADSAATLEPRGVLREVLGTFREVTGPDGRTSGYVAPHPIHPADYQRWAAAATPED